jgi:hypothetical protein
MKNRLKFALTLIFASNFLFCGFLLSGCAHKKTTTDINLVRTELDAQQTQVKTMKGRAWVTVRSQNGNGASFPVVVAIDRTSPEGFSKLYLEITDLVGETRSRVIIPAKEALVWEDFDAPAELRIRRFKKTWRGLPVALLPEVLLGLLPKSAAGVIPEAQWIEPGPRPVLSNLKGKVEGKDFEVNYKSYGDHLSFYLPNELDLKSTEVSLHLSWRERQWNVPLAPKLFDRK